MPKKTYTVKEVAKLLGYSTNTIYKYLNEKSIKAVRLGDEGRFKIPANEVERLLLEKGKSVEPVISEPSPITEILPTVTAEVKNSPSLFDWFVAFLSISIGLSLSLFPISFATQAIAVYQKITTPMQILLVLGGFAILITDVLRLKRKYWVKAVKVLVIIDFFALTIFFAIIEAIPLAIGCFSIALTMGISLLKEMTQVTRFLVFTNLLLFLLGVGGLLKPENFLLSKIVEINKTNIFRYFIAWFVALISNVYISFFVARKSRKVLWAVTGITALVATFYATYAFSEGLWSRTVFCVVFASFSVLFPFADEFESFTLRSKKELIGSLAWLLALFVIGLLMLYYIYRSFESYAVKELNQRADTAADVIVNFMDGNLSKISVFASDEELLTSMRNYSGSNIELANNNLRQLYKAANWTFLRVALFNNKGVVVDTYPFSPASQGINASDRDYFRMVKAGSAVYVSGITQLSTPGLAPAVVITMPVKDQNGSFLGAVSALVDLDELKRRIGQVKFGDSGTFLLADSSGNYIIPSTPEKILTKAEPGSYTMRGVYGESGDAEGMDGNGNLSLISFRQVDKYGWGIVAQQPVNEVLVPYSKTVFIVFLVFVVSGVGSLVLFLNLKEKG